METNIRNKCKAYTSLEQSKKLSEILPLESADMKILPFNEREYRIVPIYDIAVCGRGDEIYAWSLAALLEELNRNCWKVSLKCCGAEWDMTYDDGERYISISSDYAIDACVAMIEKLHKLKML